MGERVWLTYSPPFAPHVVGTYEERAVDPETHMPEEQRIRARCMKCGATWQTTCATGQTRQHVQRWAAVNHLHRDPFEAPTRKKP